MQKLKIISPHRYMENALIKLHSSHLIQVWMEIRIHVLCRATNKI